MNEKLNKPLKLKSKKRIEELFKEGDTTKGYPLILVHKTDNTLQSPFEVGFSVSKRHFKRAVDRNRIKRLIREYFRKNKYLFVSQQNKPKILMFIFVGKSLPCSKEIETAMQKLSKKINQVKVSN